LVEFERIHRVLTRSFLGRNWCGKRTFVGPSPQEAVALEHSRLPDGARSVGCDNVASSR
jgi:hypothetical protein